MFTDKKPFRRDKHFSCGPLRAFSIVERVALDNYAQKNGTNRKILLIQGKKFNNYNVMISINYKLLTKYNNKNFLNT